MNVISPRSRIALLLAIGSLLSPAVGGAASQLDGLLSNSPFGTAPKSGQPVDAGNQPMEFRGTLEENGQQLFSIYDTATKRSRWVGLNDTSGEVVVKSYDEGAHTISIEQGGRPLSLTLKSGPRIAQVLPVPAQPGLPPGAAGLPGQQILPNGVGKGPEAQRMQQIADEIRRRRALRQQVPQVPTPGAPVPAPGAVPGPMLTPLPGAPAGSATPPK